MADTNVPDRAFCAIDRVRGRKPDSAEGIVPDNELLATEKYLDNTHTHTHTHTANPMDDCAFRGGHEDCLLNRTYWSDCRVDNTDGIDPVNWLDDTLQDLATAFRINGHGITTRLRPSTLGELRQQ